MSKVIVDISLSVDGFITADGITPEEPLGQDGQRLHAWATGDGVERSPKPVSTVGALIAGRRTYDTSLPWWGADGPHSPTPVVVVTHEPAELAPVESAYTFVDGGIDAALEQARALAGDRDVRVMGGASLGQQFLAAGLVDEAVLHVVPVLLNAGTHMFDHLGPEHITLEVLDVVDTPAATHVRYRVLR
jgi:dihydrofolate reductase